MVLQCWSYVNVLEKLKVNDIIFGWSVCEIGLHEWLWASTYKGVEVKIVSGNVKSFVCVRDKKNLEILNQMKQIVVLKY